MLAPVETPVFRSKLPQQGMVDLKHIHAVKAGEQPLIALIVRGGVQHLVVHHLVVIAVKHLTQQIELRFQTVRERPEPSHEIVVQTVRHVQTETVDVKLFHPAFHTVQNVADHIPMAQIELHQIVIAFPSLVPETVVVVGISAEINVKPA